MSDGEQKWINRSQNNSQPLATNEGEKYFTASFMEKRDILTDDLPQSLKQFRSEVRQSMVQFRAELRGSIDAVFEQWSRRLDVILADEVQQPMMPTELVHAPMEETGLAEVNTACVEAHDLCEDRKELCSSYSLKGVESCKHEIYTKNLQPHSICEPQDHKSLDFGITRADVRDDEALTELVPSVPVMSENITVKTHDNGAFTIMKEYAHCIGLVADIDQGTPLELKCSHCTFEALRFFFEDVFHRYIKFENESGDESAFIRMSPKVQSYLEKKTPHELFGLVHAAHYLKCNVMMRFLTNKSGLLHLAAECGQAEVLRALIEGKCDVNVRVLNGETLCTALELASNETCESLLIAAGGYESVSEDGELSSQESMAESVSSENLDQSIDSESASANDDDEDMIEEMKNAVKHGCVTSMLLLLDLRADVNAIDDDGDTVLHIAAQSKNFQVVKYLLAHKADVNIENSSGLRPIQLAEGEIHRILRWREFNPDDTINVKKARPTASSSLKKKVADQKTCVRAVSSVGRSRHQQRQQWSTEEEEEALGS
jgi:hypothetical protein